MPGWSCSPPVQAINWTPQFITFLLFLSLVLTAAAFLAWFTEAVHPRLDLLTAWTLLVPVIGIDVSPFLPGELPPPAWSWPPPGLCSANPAAGHGRAGTKDSDAAHRPGR